MSSSCSSQSWCRCTSNRRMHPNLSAKLQNASRPDIVCVFLSSGASVGLSAGIPDFSLQERRYFLTMLEKKQFQQCILFGVLNFIESLCKVAKWVKAGHCLRILVEWSQCRCVGWHSQFQSARKMLLSNTWTPSIGSGEDSDDEDEFTWKEMPLKASRIQVILTTWMT